MNISVGSKLAIYCCTPTGQKISDDGQTVVVSNWSSVPHVGVVTHNNYLWNSAVGITQINGLPGYDNHGVLRLSPDGKRAFGISGGLIAGESWEWTAADGTRPLGFSARVVSADGLVWARTDENVLTIYQRTASGFQESTFVDSTTTTQYLQIYGSGVMSGDGRTLGLNSWQTNGGWEPIVWTIAEGLTAIGVKSGPDDFFNGMSHDGSVAAGPDFVWTRDDGIRDVFDGDAYGVSPDGELILGWKTGPDRAMIWDENHGTRLLQDLLVGQFGMADELNGLTLSGIDMISANRRTMRVWAYNTGAPSTEKEYVVFLDEPLLPFSASLSCGDVDRDQDVDSADLLQFLGNWTGSLDVGVGNATLGMGDCDTDRDVDSADLLEFLSHWTGAQANHVVAVPEPRYGVWVAVGMLSCRRMRLGRHNAQRLGL